MGDDTDVTSRKYSFTRISLNINGICPCVKLFFFVEFILNKYAYINFVAIACKSAIDGAACVNLPKKLSYVGIISYLCHALGKGTGCESPTVPQL